MQVVAAVDPVHGQVLEGINAGQHLGMFVHDTLIGEYQTGRRRDVLDEGRRMTLGKAQRRRQHQLRIGTPGPAAIVGHQPTLDQRCGRIPRDWRGAAQHAGRHGLFDAVVYRLALVAQLQRGVEEARHLPRSVIGFGGKRHQTVNHRGGNNAVRQTAGQYATDNRPH